MLLELFCSGQRTSTCLSSSPTLSTCILLALKEFLVSNRILIPDKINRQNHSQLRLKLELNTPSIYYADPFYVFICTCQLFLCITEQK